LFRNPITIFKDIGTIYRFYLLFAQRFFNIAFLIFSNIADLTDKYSSMNHLYIIEKTFSPLISHSARTIEAMLTKTLFSHK
jgi:RNA recognition motif-containing protein